jgi:hypothetical protein
MPKRSSKPSVGFPFPQSIVLGRADTQGDRGGISDCRHPLGAGLRAEDGLRVGRLRAGGGKAHDSQGGRQSVAVSELDPEDQPVAEGLAGLHSKTRRVRFCGHPTPYTAPRRRYWPVSCESSASPWESVCRSTDLPSNRWRRLLRHTLRRSNEQATLAFDRNRRDLAGRVD